MQKTYIVRQLLIICSQLFLISYICFMAVNGRYIMRENIIHFCLLTLLFADAAYVSYKSIKNNPILNHFSYLLLLLGWQFLFSLYETHTMSVKISIVLLPLCFYQSLHFIQIFVFQSSTYQFQKQFIAILKITCIAAVIGFLISQRAFAFTYQIQLLISLITIVIIIMIHHKRIRFLLRSQKKQFFFSAAFVLLPFICYIITFYRQPKYLDGLGSYLVVMLVFVSIHSILFQEHPCQEHYFRLKNWEVIFLVFVGITGLFLTAYLFKLPLTAVFLSVYIVMLLILLFNLLLYRQISRYQEDYKNNANYQHFYSYSLEQIKHEETLKKEFSNYLHDNILQDLLSIKNLLKKAGQPKIEQLLYNTIGELISSIRLQMQNYHPVLLQSLTLKENIQNLLDTLTEKYSITVILDCSDTVFLVEPYNVLIYRMIQELAANVLKHAQATKIQVFLIQENNIITLKVSDNGRGFDNLAYSHSAHRGIDSIQEQVSLLNGNMVIQSAPTNGTKITITMPMKGDDSYENFISR